MSGAFGGVGRCMVAGLVVLGLVGVAGCSAPWGAGQSGGGQSGDGSLPHVRMSGDYVLNDDGTLRKPHVMPTAPVIGEEASRFDERGAEAAARHFIDLINYAWASGDTVPLEEFSEERCTYCQAISQQVHEVYDTGGWAFRIDYKVMQVEEKFPSSPDAPGAAEFPNSYILTMRVQRNRADVYKDQVIEHLTQKDTRLHLVVHWDGTGWKAVAAYGEDTDAAQSE